jgi:Bacterial Ig domain
MKNPLQTLLLGLLVFASGFNAPAQTPPKLKMTRVSPTAAQISWTNQVGKSYRVQSTPSLAPAVWKPLEDAFSPDTNISVRLATTEKPIAFFRVLIPTNGTLPAVQIFSPTNTQTISGEISVRMGAQLGVQIQGVNLYLDGALVGYLNSGGMSFYLDTTHFANGLHTIYAGAVDTANNETLSGAITLDFENPVRWLDACSMFNDFVPIDVDSDIFPADWLVSVTDTNGVIVRTITGSTVDGIIQTTWDGTDDNGFPVSVENLYQVTVDVTSTGNFSMRVATSLASKLNATSVSTTMNSHGVPEFTVQKSAPNPLAAYLETGKIYKQLTPKEKLIYPPLPTKPVDNPSATTTTKMSAREMFLASRQTVGASKSAATETPTANGPAMIMSGSTRTLVWMEDQWFSKKIIVARVPIDTSLNNTVISVCGQIAAFLAMLDSSFGNNRDTFDTNVRIVQTSGEVTQLKNDLNNPNVTALYFFGHGTASGNAFGTSTTGIFATNLATLFRNYYIPAPTSSGASAGKPTLVTHKPFNFVFLDGCNTAKGDLPEAFGISKAITGAQLNEAGLHKRAFMGWTGPVVFQFDPDHINWTLKFWEVWIDGGLGDISLTDAVREAYRYRPSVLSNVPIKWYGNGSLQYHE